jgi:hypothetical protein
MVVTPSLAKGAVREAVRKQGETSRQLLDLMRKTVLKPPSTKRRYAEWFRKQTAFHERDALLIACGMSGRRTGAFAAYSLGFLGTDASWTAQISMLRIECSPGQINDIESETLPLTISGHALERLFQRTDSIDWGIIRGYLAGATLFSNAVVQAWLESGCEQCAVLADKGMFVGQVLDNTLRLRTFLPETDLGARWGTLYADMKGFSEEHEQMINSAALGLRDEANSAFKQVLESGSHRWLFRPYTPGEDSEDDAWHSASIQIEREFESLQKS